MLYGNGRRKRYARRSARTVNLYWLWHTHILYSHIQYRYAHGTHKTQEGDIQQVGRGTLHYTTHTYITAICKYFCIVWYSSGSGPLAARAARTAARRRPRFGQRAVQYSSMLRTAAVQYKAHTTLPRGIECRFWTGLFPRLEF